jgi:hypothetical protein
VIPEPPTIVVGLLTDPSLPADVARKAAQRLPQVLDERVDGRFRWVVRTHAEPVEAAPDHERLMDKARARVDGTGWDMAVCLVDLPVTTSNGCSRRPSTCGTAPRCARCRRWAGSRCAAARWT